MFAGNQRIISWSVFATLALIVAQATAWGGEPLRIRWEDRYLHIDAPGRPGGGVRIHYLEAYCRPGAHNQDWREQTVIRHQSEVLEAAADGRHIRLRDTLDDGVVVTHRITSGADEVAFELTAENPTQQVSQAQWAQPCIRLDQFTGRGKLDYIPLCFVFVDGRLTRLPTEPWATEARYVPGQVYRAPGVDPADVNPRPLSSIVPSNGLMGCYSGDERWIVATAWEPYQELFQGVATCIHNDFRIGGLQPGERKTIRGKFYLMPADELNALLERYRGDFPQQAGTMVLPHD